MCWSFSGGGVALGDGRGIARWACYWVLGSGEIILGSGGVNDGEGYWDSIKRQSEALEGIMRK